MLSKVLSAHFALISDYDWHILTPKNKNKLVDFKDNNSVIQCFVNIRPICRSNMAFVSTLLKFKTLNTQVFRQILGISNKEVVLK